MFRMTEGSFDKIATIGVGAFGRVELVCLHNDRSTTFALKAMKKKHIGTSLLQILQYS